jgi:hypothetical protein
MPGPDNNANSYFQISHINRSDSDATIGEIIVTSKKIETGWLPANDILNNMRKAVHMMKQALITHVTGIDDEEKTDELWESQTFTAYDKTEYIKSYFEPINDQEKRISFLEN